MNSYLLLTGNLANCTCNYSPDEELVPEKPQIIITANPGYQFLGSYTLYQNDEWGGGDQPLVKNDTSTVLTYDIPEWVFTLEFYDIDLNSDYTATLIPKTLSAFVNLYKVDDSILSKLSEVRFQSGKDWGNQILMLYEIPMDVPPELIGSDSPIILGAFDSKVKAPQILKGEFSIDCGIIYLTPTYDNGIDYLPSYRTLTLISPFFDSFRLPVEVFLNHPCSVKYVINLYGGTISRIITETDSGLQYRSTTPIANNIPFIDKNTNSVVNSLSTYTYFDSKVAIIDKQQNYLQPESFTSYYGVSEFCCKPLAEVHGYVEIENIDLKTCASEPHQREIKKLLHDGVFIN